MSAAENTNPKAKRKTLTLRDWILAALFAALTAVGAKLSFPLGATNITLQMFFVLLAGILLGHRVGLLSQLIYLLLGLIGLPIFTAGGGLGYVFHPSFGFLLGFLAMAFISGYVSRKLSYIKPFWAILIGTVIAWMVLYLIGLPYMGWALSKMGKTLTVRALLTAGMLVYLPGDLLKVVIAVPLGTRLLPLIKRYHQSTR